MKHSRSSVVTLVGSAAMLASALLLPLVNLMSYSFTMFDLPHKIERLVKGDVNQLVGYVLLALLALAPLLSGLMALLRKRQPRWLFIVPVVVAAVLLVLLLVASVPSPAIGLWIYLVLAVFLALFNVF